MLHRECRAARCSAVCERAGRGGRVSIEILFGVPLQLRRTEVEYVAVCLVVAWPDERKNEQCFTTGKLRRRLIQFNFTLRNASVGHSFNERLLKSTTLVSLLPPIQQFNVGRGGKFEFFFPAPDQLNTEL